MRYLIYSYCFETPHFETEMEIALKLKNQGHEVFFLVCDEDLKTCFINPDHSKAICAVCKSKIYNGLKVLQISEDHILNFKKISIERSNYISALSSFESLLAFKYNGSDVGLAVASSIISATRDHCFDINQFQEQVCVGLETAIMVHENLEILLNEIRPDGVIMFNGRFLEARPVLRLCEKMEINFFTHERGGKIDRYMFRENSTPHSLSFAEEEIEQLWGNGSQEKEAIGKSFFQERRNKVIQSWHVYTKDQVDGSLPKGFDKSKRNIGIFNSSIDEYVTIPDFNNKLYGDDNEGIERICQSFLNYPEFHFYLRVHPNLKGLNTTQTRRIDEISKLYKNLTVIRAEDIIDSYALVEAVEKVISFGSTMGIEALYWNKPSILLGRAYYETINGVIIPDSHEQAVISVMDKVVTVSNLAAIKFGYWCLTYGTKYDFFEAESLFNGKFLGQRIKAGYFARIRRKLKTLIRKTN